VIRSGDPFFELPIHQHFIPIISVSMPSINPVVALNLALRFIRPLAVKERLLNQCHLLDSSNGDVWKSSSFL